MDTNTIISKSSLEDLIDVYTNQFQSSFPLIGMSEETAINILTQCIKTNTPYDPEVSETLII